MNSTLGWALAVAAVAAGSVGYGWRGVVLALSVVVFWLLLQFSRTLRVMRKAAQQPVGHVANAVMLHARLHAGMHLTQVLAVTRSLGRKLADDPETFAWQDEQGDAVEVEFDDGSASVWRLRRAPAADGVAPAPGPEA